MRKQFHNSKQFYNMRQKNCLAIHDAVNWNKRPLCNFKSSLLGPRSKVFATSGLLVKWHFLQICSWWFMFPLQWSLVTTLKLFDLQSMLNPNIIVMELERTAEVMPNPGEMLCLNQTPQHLQSFPNIILIHYISKCKMGTWETHAWECMHHKEMLIRCLGLRDTVPDFLSNKH